MMLNAAVRSALRSALEEVVRKQSEQTDIMNGARDAGRFDVAMQAQATRNGLMMAETILRDRIQVLA